MSIEKLSELLRKAVENEQYEEASKIKSEIDRRNNE
jgi:protein-arginine kinase activator protein McsA